MKRDLRVLAAVDFSKYSEDVVKSAATMAFKFDADMILLHVITPSEIRMIKNTALKLKRLTSRLSIEDLFGKLKAEREESMKKLVFLDEMSYIEKRSFVVTGAPEKEISKMAVDFGVDYLFVGEKGNTDLSDGIAGSVTQKLVRRCPATLVIVRQKNFRTKIDMQLSRHQQHQKQVYRYTNN